MNVNKPPLWQNGNWQTDGGSMSFESYPENTLIGYPLNLWDNGPMSNNSGKTNSRGSRRINGRNDDDSTYSNIIEEGFESNGGIGSSGGNYQNKNSKNSKKNHYLEKFANNDNNNENCDSCKKITWNWITLSLMLVIFMMIALIFSIK